MRTDFRHLYVKKDGKVVLQVGSYEGHREFYDLNVKCEFELKKCEFCYFI